MRGFLASIVTATALLAASGCAQAADATSTRSYTILDENGSQLRKDFDRAKGSVRLLFVVDPVCAVCLRGLDDLNRSLLGRTDDQRLQTFVVHVPVIGGEAKDVAPAARLLQNAYVRHYWNPSGAFGRTLAEAVELRRHDEDELVYAWDVWLIYGSEASWDGERPPQPRRLMHQLPELQDSAKFPRLDSEVFAKEVNQFLTKLPTAHSGP